MTTRSGLGTYGTSSVSTERKTTFWCNTLLCLWLVQPTLMVYTMAYTDG